MPACCHRKFYDGTLVYNVIYPVLNIIICLFVRPANAKSSGSIFDWIIELHFSWHLSFPNIIHFLFVSLQCPISMLHTFCSLRNNWCFMLELSLCYNIPLIMFYYMEYYNWQVETAMSVCLFDSTLNQTLDYLDSVLHSNCQVSDPNRPCTNAVSSNCLHT